MTFFTDYLVYYLIKGLGALIRSVPVEVALWIGRMLGLLAYTFDVKHRTLAYANLKVAFANTKNLQEIKKILKTLFQNYGQNFIELLRLPLMTPDIFWKYVRLEHKEYILDAHKKGKGVIILAMHYGSWELASLASALLGVPYKMLVKPQTRFSRLDNLLNSYRLANGLMVIEKGSGTRQFVESLKKNEVIGMVMDQGGKGGVLIPFLGRQASMAVGAVRMGLKLGVPICFAIIKREKGPYHHFIVHPPLEMERTGDVEMDIVRNMQNIVRLMEGYIREAPEEYAWFYKIWKYSKEATTVILHDGRVGHLRQSETIAKLVTTALDERRISNALKILPIDYRSKFHAACLTALGVVLPPFVFQGRLGFLRWFVSPDSYKKLMGIKADFVISCGSQTAPLNYFLSHDYQAKSVSILQPGCLNPDEFDLVIMPQHDRKKVKRQKPAVVFTVGAPNLVSPAYCREQEQLLLTRYSHLKNRDNFKIALLLGGDTKDYCLSEQKVKIVIHQIREAAEVLKADVLVTTSRRTPATIENLVMRELKKYPRCPLIIIANRQDVPEAVGGILGLTNIVVVSGDSISMISEAASSGKSTIVFPAQRRHNLRIEQHKHTRFIDVLAGQGYVYPAEATEIRQAVSDIAKSKIHLKTLNDNDALQEALKKII